MPRGARNRYLAASLPGGDANSTTMIGMPPVGILRVRMQRYCVLRLIMMLFWRPIDYFSISSIHFTPTIGDVFVAREKVFVVVFQGLQRDRILSSISSTCRFYGYFSLVVFQYHMKFSGFFSAFLLMSIFGAADASAQQSFQLSSKFHEASFVRGTVWDGRHRFDNVFCLSFPRSTEAEAVAEAMYNNNTLYFSRAAYKDLTALYVVTSTVPAGRSVETEIENLASQNQRNVDAYPANFKQSRATGLLGPSLVLTVRNSTEGANESPFPFVRSIANRPDGQLSSLSVHRLFVHGRDRIEVAGLRYFKTPLGSEREAGAVSELSAFVEAAAVSLQSCTVNLPPRAQ